jgi:hypothetical protein
MGLPSCGPALGMLARNFALADARAARLFHRQIRELSLSLQSKNGEVSVLRAQVEQKKRELTRVEGEKMSLVQQMKSGSGGGGGRGHPGANADAQRQVSQLKSSLNFKENELGEARKRIQQLGAEMQRSQRKLDELEAGYSALQQELAETAALQQAASSAPPRAAKMAKRAMSDAGTQAALTAPGRAVRSAAPPALPSASAARRLRLLKTLLPDNQSEGVVALVAGGAGDPGGGRPDAARLYEAVAGLVHGVVPPRELLARLDAALRSGRRADARAALECLAAVLTESAACRAVVLEGAGADAGGDAAMAEADGGTAASAGGSASRPDAAPHSDGAAGRAGAALDVGDGPLLRLLLRLAVAVSPPPSPPPRTKWTRRVPHSVLIGHAASLRLRSRGGRRKRGRTRRRCCACCGYCGGPRRPRRPRRSFRCCPRGSLPRKSPRATPRDPPRFDAGTHPCRLSPLFPPLSLLLLLSHLARFLSLSLFSRPSDTAPSRARV